MYFILCFSSLSLVCVHLGSLLFSPHSFSFACFSSDFFFFPLSLFCLCFSLSFFLLPLLLTGGGHVLKSSRDGPPSPRTARDGSLAPRALSLS